jgi:hypothetical protein
MVERRPARNGNGTPPKADAQPAEEANGADGARGDGRGTADVLGDGLEVRRGPGRTDTEILWIYWELAAIDQGAEICEMRTSFPFLPHKD